jgi:putative oxidoreductase
MNRTQKVLWWTQRVVLGILMLAGAATHVLNIKEGEMAKSAFITALVDTGYLWPILGVTELLCGLAILAGRFVALALVVLVPITLNILLFHLTNPSPDGIGIALAIVLPHLGLLWMYRRVYARLFEAKHLPGNAGT